LVKEIKTSWLDVRIQNKTHFIVKSFADLFHVATVMLPRTVRIRVWGTLHVQKQTLLGQNSALKADAAF